MTTNIELINLNLNVDCKSLPENFEFKILNMSHLTDIHDLLNNNYIKNPNCGVRTIFTKDYLYWYLKLVPAGFIIGLTFKQKLVGMICSQFFDVIIHQTSLKVPYISLLCVHAKIRNLGLASCLINKISHIILKTGMPYTLFTTIEYDSEYATFTSKLESTSTSKSKSTSTSKSESKTESKSESKSESESDITRLLCEVELCVVPLNCAK